MTAADSRHVRTREAMLDIIVWRIQVGKWHRSDRLAVPIRHPRDLNVWSLDTIYPVDVLA